MYSLACILAVNIIMIARHTVPASSISPLTGGRTYTRFELQRNAQVLSLPGQSLSLVGEDADFFYLGAREALYKIRADSLSSFARVVRWQQPQQLDRSQAVGGGSGGGRVRSLYFSGPGVAYVCAAAVDGNGGGSAGGSAIGDSVGRCRKFDRCSDSAAADCEWRQSSSASSSGGAIGGVNQLLGAILLPCGGAGCPPPVSLKRAGSHVFFAALPPIRRTTDLVELAGPEFADIGFTTADLYSRRNRALWIARGARALRMHEASGRLYVVYTEEAAETSNYVDSVNAERQGLVRKPTFTRLGRVCLNDPGQTPPGNQTTPRVLTSFFKLRLVCRDNDTDYDVMQLATEVGDVADGGGHFYGLFAPQNSPPGGYLALCRFRIADAERLLTGDDASGVGDFIEMSRPDWQSPWSARRLTRAQFVARSELRRPFDCSWTAEEAARIRLKDLYVERMAPLLARPLIGRSLRTLPPSYRGRGRPRQATALTLLPARDGADDQLLIGWDSGHVTRLNPDSPVAPIETLDALPGQAVDAVRVRDSPEGGPRRLVAFGAAGMASLPLTRCSAAATCAACRRLGDPLCVWHQPAWACRDRAELRGVSESAAACDTIGRVDGVNNGSSATVSDADSDADGSQRMSSGPRLSASSLGGGIVGDARLSMDGAVGGVSVGVFIGVLLAACLFAFLAGGALGCVAKSRKKPPRALTALLTRGFSFGSSGAGGGSSSGSRAQPPSAPSSEADAYMNESSKQPLKPRHTQQQQLLQPPQQWRGGGRRDPRGLRPAASSPLIGSAAVSAEEQHRHGNEYVQVADLIGPSLAVPAAAPAAAAAAPSSRCSSWESCLTDSDNAPATMASPNGDLLTQPQLHLPSQQQRHPYSLQQPMQQQQVKVNAGFIGQICLSVDLSNPAGN